MATIVNCQEFFAVACGNQAKIFRKGCDECETITTPVHGNSDLPEHSGNILCLALSLDGTYLAISDDNKLLHLYSTDNTCHLLSTRETTRRCTKLVFSPDGNSLLTADKTGDVYLFSTSNVNQSGRLLLGHLSIILDVVFSAPGNYVVTSDRDEKICIANFPNAYSIHAFCLGHTSFVSRLACVTLNSLQVLISGSGDGTLRMWNLNGEPLHCQKIKVHNCEPIKRASLLMQYTNSADSSQDMHSFEESASTNNDDSQQTLQSKEESQKAAEKHESADVPAVKHLCYCHSKALLAVSFYRHRCVQTYRIYNDDVGVTSDLVSEVCVAAPPWDMCIHNEETLCVLVCDPCQPLQVFLMTSTDLRQIDAKFYFMEKYPEMADSKLLWGFLKDAQVDCDLTQLNKVRVDFTVEYYNRKQQRIMGKRKAQQMDNEEWKDREMTMNSKKQDLSV